ncbi:MAG: hypothetical protein NTZ72_13725 [Afipia sp.]|nr:hypothetical protein [Afipia sp.]
MARNLFTGELIVIEQPKKKARRKEVQPIRRPAYCGESNDIVGWFRENTPQTLAECNDIRKALRLKKRVGKYDADVHDARTGRRLIRVKGPVSNVMIVSKKARAYFSKRLRNREIYLGVFAEQFGAKHDDKNSECRS